MKVKGETQMRTVKIYFLILSIALVTVYFLQLPAAHADFVYVDNVAKDPTIFPPSIHRSRPQTVTVNLSAEEYIAEIADGKDAWVWTFSDEDNPVEHGTIPGPMIRVMVGDTVVINLTNNMGNIEPHNIRTPDFSEFNLSPICRSFACQFPGR
jgi:nitrite reductase (NO-forming)